MCFTGHLGHEKRTTVLVMQAIQGSHPPYNLTLLKIPNKFCKEFGPAEIAKNATG